ncbi:hypothetical protein Cs7R123_49580 [Catellatospora sp. TT07R-123]|uniref:hypothetical protein n=1 Tax=Catellatospora sp. TT07R-123 TaxID=2733863 RepID=UPI001B05132C|nr:hypothetical protein [Catellatospora sp. TT07R-123]GHJ47616.1 hypothetical protein Cs7R123_49580 [Catellatospora sp. TT07R-123]
MRFFIQESRDPGLHDLTDGAFGMRATDDYVELEMRLDDSCLVMYAVPYGPRQVAFVANLDDEIDVLLDDVSGATEEQGRRLAAEYPTFARLLFNGEQDDLASGALLPMTDPDTREETVVVAVLLEGVDTGFPETWFDAAGMERLQLLTELTATLLDENHERTTITL